MEDRSFHQTIGARDGINGVKFITIDGHKENVRSVAPLGGFGNLEKRGVYSLKQTELQLVILEG